MAIGVTAAEVTALGSLTTAARAAYNAQQAAQDAAKAATQKFSDAVRAMQASGSDLIRKIKAKAESGVGDPNVYVLAQIPAPASAGVVPPPGTPFEFKVELLQNGALKLGWKCQNPAGSVGTIYEVRRRNSATAAFVYVGSTGVKSFTDDAIPTGLSAVTYQVVAVRSTARGNPAQFNVNFGTTGGAAGSQTVASVSESPRLAA